MSKQQLKPDEAPVLVELSFVRRLLNEEIVDAKAQRDTAQQQLNAAVERGQRAQQDGAQAQQDANVAQAMVLTGNGAVQGLENALKLLETQKPVPATP